MPKKSKNKEASERKKGRKKKEESSLLTQENQRFSGPKKAKLFAKKEILERKEKEENFNVEVNLGERETLEELAERPETLETEASDFSEFVATSSEMPTLTLPSSTTPTAATNENLESAAASIASSSERSEGTAPYFSRDYEDYFGKSYAQDLYKRKEEFRELTKQNVQEKPIIHAPPLVRKWEEAGVQQSAEEWGRVEKEIRDYTVENIAKKEARKRKLID